MDLQRFYAGACFDAYRYLGGHMEAEGGVSAPLPPARPGCLCWRSGRTGRSAPWSGCWTGISGRRAAQGPCRASGISTASGKGMAAFWTTATPTASGWRSGPTRPLSSAGRSRTTSSATRPGWPPAPPVRTGPCTSTRSTPALGKSRGPGLRIGTIGPAGGAAAALRPGAGLQLHRVPPLKRAPQRRILGLSEHGVFLDPPLATAVPGS